MREGADDRAILDPDPGADHDVGLDDDVAADLGVEREEHRLGSDKRRALGHRPPAQPILQFRLGPGELRPVVDAHHLLFVGHERPRDEAPRVGDFDDVGEVIFALSVVGRHSGQKFQSFLPIEGDRPGVAPTRSPLLGACVLMLADRDQAPVTFDQPPVAGRFGGLEAERDHIRAAGKLGASAARVTGLISGISA